MTSHLKAMKEFLKTDEPYAFIIEDDCDFDPVRYWNIYLERCYVKDSI